MSRHLRLLSTTVAVTVFAGWAAVATAQTTPGSQDPSTTGQLNKCWGEAASGTAQLETPDDTNGGAMGQHSRSTTAANKNGGFASDDNAAGITFNEENEDGNHGRNGVGNQTRDFHDTEPGDGGQGVHAINNVNASRFFDPVTGTFGPSSELASNVSEECGGDAP